MTQCLRVARWVPTVDPAEIGDGVITINPPTAHKSLDTKFQLAGGGTGGGGIGEAPSDGQQYCRVNAAWAVAQGPPVIDGGTF